MYRSSLTSVPSAVAGMFEFRFSDVEPPGGRCELRTLFCYASPAVAEESKLSVSDLGPHRCPIIVDSCILLSIVGELVLGTFRRCGRSGVLAARVRFGFAADLELSHVQLFYIYEG